MLQMFQMHLRKIVHCFPPLFLQGNIQLTVRTDLLYIGPVSYTHLLLSANITDFSTTLAAYTVSGGDGINGVKALSAQRVGNTFYFAEPNDITVYDLQGRMLKQANHATSVSIGDLNQGIYILSNGKSSLKTIK